MRWVRFWAFANGALVLTLIGAALLGSDGIAHHERLSEEVSRASALNKQFERDNAELARKADALRNNPEYVESVIRDQLNWIRSDEVIFMLPPDHAPQERGE